MGRVATHLAARALFADNTPPSEKLPSVSVIDALLPKSWSIPGSNRKNPLDPNVRLSPSSVHTDVKKDKNGKMVMVRHRSKNGSVVNAEEKVTFNEVKKSKNNESGDKGKNDGGGGAAGAAFTAEEDAKLKELKLGGGTWKGMAQEMGRPQHELKARWKEIEGKPDTSGDQKKDGGDKDNKAAASGGADFTAEDDKKIKELLATNTGFKKIAAALGRNLDNPLKDHINKLKDEGGGNEEKKKNEKNDKDDKTGSGGEFSKKDKQKIKELLESNTGYKQIAEALNRALDQPLKDEIGRIKAEGGDGGNKKKGEDGKKDKNKGGDGGGKNDGNKKEKEKPKKDDSKTKKAASKAPTHRSEARFTMEEWRMLQEDEMFTLSELQLLSEIIMKDGGPSWLRVASRFHDKTGRRVHPDDIRDKFDQMAQMEK